jgi:phospholipid/cholesterol/gamma-HCH transport system ATP-binding protein
MTVRENLEFPLRRHTKKIWSPKKTLHLVMQALEKCGISIANLMPAELSQAE